MIEQSPTCDKILEAAKERFKHYGYGKTTMAEIAADCNMSPGNLYRYFASKLDIAEQIAQTSLEAMITDMRKAVDKPGLSPTEKLKAYLTGVLEYTHQRVDLDPKIVEIAHIIFSERPRIAERQFGEERSVIEGILSEGNRPGGEFDIEDISFTAHLIQRATMLYRYPQLHGYFGLDILQKELLGIIDMMLNGIRRRD